MLRTSTTISGRRLRLLASLLAFTLAAWGCEDQSVVAVAVAEVEVEPSEETIGTGQSLQLSATPLDPAGAPLEREVVWASEDESVVSVSPDGVVEGRAPGSTRVVASSGGAEGHALINVTPPPRIGASPATVELTATEGDEVADALEIRIENEGSGSLEGLSASVSYASEQGWLQVTLQETTAPAVASLRATAAALPPGDHRATVEIVAPHAENSPFGVQVVLRVEARAPMLRLSTSASGFVWEQGRAGPPPQTVTVSSDGDRLSGLERSIRYESNQPDGWLAAELSGSSTPAELTLRVFPQAFSPGRYDATIRIRSPDAGNTAELRVRLTVAEPPPRIQLSRDALTFTMARGGAAPEPVSVRVENAGGGELTGLSTNVSHAGSASEWLRADLGGSSAPTDLELGVSAFDLPVGRYEAVVEVRSPHADNSPRSLAVRLDVADPVRIVDLDFRTSGFLGRHLHVTLALETDAGAPVPDADVTIEIRNTDRGQSWTRAGRTGTDGRVTLDLANHPTGCYRIVVLEIAAAGTAWDGHTPEHDYCRSWSFFESPEGF